ncbi:hypothetical protein GCM10009845_11790 [Pedococcus bigeumensis]|jgi:hypothetical protein
MTTAKHVPPVKAPSSGGQVTNLRRAWIAVALIPVAFVLAFAVGEGLYTLLGYQPEDATEPLWVALVAGVPAIVLFLVPCAAAVWYGNKARVEGHRAGLVPLAAGAALGLWMVVMNTVSLFAG